MFNSTEKSDPLSSVFIGQTVSPFIDCCSAAGRRRRVGDRCGRRARRAPEGLAFVLFTRLKTTPAITASLITGIEPILNPLWVALFYKEVFTPVAMAGAVIVFVTVIAYNYHKGKQQPAEAGEG